MKIWIWILVVVIVLIAAYFLLAGTDTPVEEPTEEAVETTEDLDATANVADIVVEEVVADEVVE